MGDMNQQAATTVIGRLARAEAYFSLVESRVGNAQALFDYWSTGEGGRTRIRWGTPRDMTRCIDLVTREAGPAAATFNVPGFCQRAHIRALGRPNDPDD